MEFTRLKDDRKKNAKKEKEVNGADIKNASEVEDVDLNYKAKVKGKSWVKRDKIRGSYFEEPTTDDVQEDDDDDKFKQKVVNDVEMDVGPKEDSVKRENLLTMQACFIVLATKSRDISGEVLKALQDVSSQIKGEHVLDVYKLYRTRRSTVKISSNCSNRFCYKFPTWITDGTELKRLMCLGRLTCEQMMDVGKLTSRKLARWKEGCLQDLKGVVDAAQPGIGDGIVKLASEVVRFGLWTKGESRRVELRWARIESPYWNDDLEDSYEEKKC